MTAQGRIAVALPAPLAARLQAAGCTMRMDALRADEEDAADVVVLDPRMAVAPDGNPGLARHAAMLGAPCLFYTSSAPPALQAVVALRHLDPVRVLVAGVDDSPESLRAAIADAILRGDTAGLPRAMARTLVELPPTLQFALDLALRRPEQFFDASDIARHAGFSRRHVDRVLHEHGLAPAKQWVIAARVWHALQLQRGRRMTSADAAARLGYADPKALRRHRDSVLGPVGSLANRAPDGRDAVLARLQGYLTSHHEVDREDALAAS